MGSTGESAGKRTSRSLLIGFLAGGVLVLLASVAIYAHVYHAKERRSIAAPHVEAARTGVTAATAAAPTTSQSEPTPVVTPETPEDQEAPDPMNCYAVHDFADAAHQTPETRRAFATKTSEEAKARGIRVGTWGAGDEHLAFIALRDNEAELRKTEARTIQPDMLAGLCVLGFAQVEFSVMDDRTHIETIGRASTNATDAMNYLKSHPAQ